MEFFSQMIYFGGPGVILTAAVILLGFAVAVERGWAILVRLRVNSREFMNQIEKLIAVGNLERAVKLCHAAGDAALPSVIKAGLKRASDGPEAISAALDEEAARVQPFLEKRFDWLFALAVGAALLGFFGTSLGLYRSLDSFYGISLGQGLSLFARRASMSILSAALGAGAAFVLLCLRAWLLERARHIRADIQWHSARVRRLLEERACTSQPSLAVIDSASDGTRSALTAE